MRQGPCAIVIGSGDSNMKPSYSEFITIRGLRCHVRRWGGGDARKLFMLHGWMDVSASFQFIVDCLRRERQVIAPDWRGFGLSQPSGADTYWFPDYLGDLDALLEHYAPGEAADLVGHSMGGNVAMLYAGVRPRRIRRLVNLEGFGLPATAPQQAPERYARWLDALRAPPHMRAYRSLDEVAARLKQNNPRLDDERAAFLAGHWAAQNEDGAWNILGDPAHRVPHPVLYQLDQALACWQRIEAPVLWVEADGSEVRRRMGPKECVRAEIDRRIACIPRVKILTVGNAGHMLHHDRPQAVADAIDDFLSA